MFRVAVDGLATTFGFTATTTNGNYAAPAVTCSTP
jgi:hypothetical protein